MCKHTCIQMFIENYYAYFFKRLHTQIYIYDEKDERLKRQQHITLMKKMFTCYVNFSNNVWVHRKVLYTSHQHCTYSVPGTLLSIHNNSFNSQSMRKILSSYAFKDVEAEVKTLSHLSRC